jgi:hypothetical protein
MPIIAQLEITLDDAGQVSVNGDIIKNKMAAYGLLALAQEAIQDFHVQAARKIQPASAAERLALLNGGKN